MLFRCSDLLLLNFLGLFVECHDSVMILCGPPGCKSISGRLNPTVDDGWIVIEREESNSLEQVCGRVLIDYRWALPYGVYCPTHCHSDQWLDHHQIVYPDSGVSVWVRVWIRDANEGS